MPRVVHFEIIASFSSFFARSFLEAPKWIMFCWGSGAKILIGDAVTTFFGWGILLL